MTDEEMNFEDKVATNYYDLDDEEYYGIPKVSKKVAYEY